MWKVIKRYKETLTMTRRPGSGRKSGLVDIKLADRVTKLVDQKPNSTVRELAVNSQLARHGHRRYLLLKGASIRDVRGFSRFFDHPPSCSHLSKLLDLLRHLYVVFLFQTRILFNIPKWAQNNHTTFFEELVQSLLDCYTQLPRY